MFKVRISRGWNATLALLVAAFKDQLTLTPEQLVELEAISTKSALKAWAQDNTIEVEDEATAVNTTGNLPELYQGSYLLKYAQTENEPRIEGVQAYLVNLGYSSGARSIEAENGGFVAITYMIGGKQYSQSLPPEQILVACSSGAFGLGKDERKEAAKFLEKVRNIRNLAVAEREAARRNVRKEIGEWMEGKSFAPDYVTINGRNQISNVTTFFKEVGTKDDFDYHAERFAAGARVEIVKAVRDSRDGDTFTFGAGEEVVGVLVYHATSNLQVIGMSKSSENAFERTYGDTVKIATEVNRAAAFNDENVAKNIAESEGKQFAATYKVLQDMPSEIRNAMLHLPKYAAFAPLFGVRVGVTADN